MEDFYRYAGHVPKDKNKRKAEDLRINRSPQVRELIDLYRDYILTIVCNTI
ncbi:MAG TPA: hypothetical protein PL018_08120 [Ignavibacteriaceae bacterium]|nr:hypothetical protein [Ignavibacteriaceae bacterium]HRQ54207.1 hypothetical protein [Ignavibacteriaceae bacterium]